jgi:hypothetical protein
MSKCVESYDELNMKFIKIEHSNSSEVVEATEIVVEKKKSPPFEMR